MKEKEVVEENEEEEEGINKFFHIHTSSHTHTHINTVQFENREHPPSCSVRPPPSGAGGLVQQFVCPSPLGSNLT